MKQSNLWLILSIAGVLTSPMVYAEDTAMDEDTVTVVDEGETPEDVANTITLPDAASDVAHERAAFGQGVANQAHEQAQELGRDFGQDVSEQARNRELSNEIRA